MHSNQKLVAKGARLLIFRSQNAGIQTVSIHLEKRDDLSETCVNYELSAFSGSPESSALWKRSVQYVNRC